MAAIKLLDWDDEEEPTRETVPYSHARETHPSAPAVPVQLTSPSVIELEVAPDDLEEAPPTEIDTLPRHDWPADDDEDECTLRTPVPPAPERMAPDSFADATLERLDELVLEPSSGRNTLVSEVEGALLPFLDGDDFDSRDTTRRPSSLPPPPAQPQSTALPLGRPVLAPLSSIPPTVVSDAPPDLAAENRRLRAQLRIASAIGVMALAGCALLGAKLAGHPQARQTLRTELAPVAPAAGGQAPRPTRQGIRVRSEQPNVRLLLDGSDRGPLPLELPDLSAGRHQLRFVGGDDWAPLDKTVTLAAGELVDLGTITLPERKVEVTLTLLAPGANVVIAAHGAAGRPLSGPWPMTLQLTPGSYAIFAAGGGLKARSIPLHLTRSMTRREVQIGLR
ncbi:MAG: PEGA domain-containing protein [Deltaproteobacteria bacterium]|nr:PEGA domain-containing protein [Deltaproteobacteria bacterium]